MSGNAKSLKRKRNKKYYCGQNAKKKKIEDLTPGIHGFLITFNERQGAPVVSEAYALLNEYADCLYGPEKIEDSNSNSDDEDQSIEDAIKKEVSELKSRKLKERRFKAVKVKVKNLVFIKTNLENPNKLTEAIFTDLEKKKISKTRRCIKCMPILATCYASQDSIKTQTEKLFRNFFEQGRTEATYCIVFKARCNNTVQRDGVIQEIGKIIEDQNEEWRVNYNDPDYTIAVHIIANICAIGILPHFKRFRNYNLQSFGLEGKLKETEKKNLQSLAEVLEAQTQHDQNSKIETLVKGASNKGTEKDNEQEESLSNESKLVQKDMDIEDVSSKAGLRDIQCNEEEPV